MKGQSANSFAIVTQKTPRLSDILLYIIYFISYIIRVFRAKWVVFKENLKKKLVYRGFLSLCSVVKSGKAIVWLIIDICCAKKI